MHPRDRHFLDASKPARYRRLQRRNRAIVALACASLVATACAWDPSHPFDHDVPEVNKAISALDAGDAAVAAETLEDYLKTGECNNGSLGIPDLVKKKPDGTFDLGLALFKIGESFGQRFGDEDEPDAGPPDAVAKRQASVNCALHVVDAIASGVPATNQEPGEAASIALRARAHYLAGNLHFMLGEYEDAVKEYDAALGLAPGEEDGGDPVGRDAAWNRAIALRRIEDKKKDSGLPDGGNGDGGQSSNDGGKDGGGNDGGSDGGGNKNDKNDAGKDSGSNQPDAGQPPPPETQPDAGTPPPPPESSNADDRILDQLERAPTVQQEAAKKAAARNHSRGMIDK
ncbi:MAG: tetratricopeptide repeat protein [Polyangiaceae bacterium]